MGIFDDIDDDSDFEYIEPEAREVNERICENFRRRASRNAKPRVTFRAQDDWEFATYRKSDSPKRLRRWGSLIVGVQRYYEVFAADTEEVLEEVEYDVPRPSPALSVINLHRYMTELEVFPNPKIIVRIGFQQAAAALLLEATTFRLPKTWSLYSSLVSWPSKSVRLPSSPCLLIQQSATYGTSEEPELLQLWDKSHSRRGIAPPRKPSPIKRFLRRLLPRCFQA